MQGRCGKSRLFRGRFAGPGKTGRSEKNRLTRDAIAKAQHRAAPAGGFFRGETAVKGRPIKMKMLPDPLRANHLAPDGNALDIFQNQLVRLTVDARQAVAFDPEFFRSFLARSGKEPR